jgi:heptosyltransferase-2/heptosyltransferase-3
MGTSTQAHRAPVRAPALIPLVVRFGRLGDMVLQTPLLHLLHHRYRHPCILLTSGPWSSALFKGSQDVHELWQLRARHAPFVLSPERWSLVRKLRRHSGPVYVTEDSIRQVPKIRRLLTLAGIGPERCAFLSDSPAEPGEHWVDQLLRLGRKTPSAIRASDYPASHESQWMAPRLDIHPADRVDRDAWLRARGFDSEKPLVLLQPGNKRSMKWGRQRRHDAKAWPVERWIGLLNAMRLQLPTATLLLCGSAAETSLLREIRDAAKVHEVAIAADDLPLRRFVGLLEIAHSMVSVDTGPAHMAAAVGCPLVVLYGEESPLRWSRRSPMHQPVIELGGPPEHEKAEAIPLQRVIEAWISLAQRNLTKQPLDCSIRSS